MAKRGTVAGVVGQDPTLPDVSFQVKGTKYHLCFDFNAVATVYQETGINLLDDGVVTNPNPIVMRALLHAALLFHHPAQKIQETGALITINNFAEIMEKVGEAWSESNPEVDASKNAASAPSETPK